MFIVSIVSFIDGGGTTSAAQITENIGQATRQADLSQIRLEENVDSMKQSLLLVNQTQEAFTSINHSVGELAVRSLRDCGGNNLSQGIDGRD